MNAMTPAERAFVEENWWALRRTLGGVVHQMVASALRKYGVQYLRVGPDFLFRIGEEEIYIELTTPAQIAAHEARAAVNPLYSVAEIVTYILIL